MEFLKVKFEKIELLRDIQNKRDIKRQIQNDQDEIKEHNDRIKLHIPAHKYCQVCYQGF